MATILSQGSVGDGYDVRVLEAGVAETFHFRQPPTDVAATIAAIYQAREDARLIFVIQGEND